VVIDLLSPQTFRAALRGREPDAEERHRPADDLERSDRLARRDAEHEPEHRDEVDE
jgi:hypothetical protein